MQIATDKLFKYGEAANILNISPATLRRWVMERRIPYMKIGTAVRFDPEKLQQYLNQSERGSRS